MLGVEHGFGEQFRAALHPSPMELIDPERMTLSFAGCGFLCIYHAGVAAAIKEYAPQLTRNKIYGASAGSIVGAGLICNVCISEATTLILKAVSQANSTPLTSMNPNFNLMQIVTDGLERMLPANAHELCTGRLVISLTRWSDFKNVRVDTFNTRQELIDAILCSSFIPLYSGFARPRYRGVEYCDGGISDNQPVQDENTITVSPFSGDADICPSDSDSASILAIDFHNTPIRVTTQNFFRLFSCLFPASLDTCSRMCRQGFQDALILLNKKGLAPCVRCLTIQSNLLPTPHFSPNASMSSRATPARLRNNSITMPSRSSRRRLESECEVCFDEGADYPPDATALFPPIIQKALDDAKDAESRILKWLYGYRVVRYTRRMMFPLDVMLSMVRGIQTWLSIPSAARFFVQRFHSTLDFILTELSKQSWLSQYVSQYPLLAAQLRQRLDDETRRQSAEAKLRAIDAPMEVDGPNAMGDLALSEQVAAEVVAVEGACPPSVAPPAGMEMDVDDSMSRLVEYSGEHDAVLAFYYTDENKKVQVCEIFDVQHPRKRPQRRAPPPARSRHSATGGRPISLIRETDDIEEAAAAEALALAQQPPQQQPLVKPPLGDHEDSGLSLAEDNSAMSSGRGSAVMKRDACCSPVHSFDDAQPSTSTGGGGAHGDHRHHHYRTIVPASGPSASTSAQPSASGSRRHTIGSGAATSSAGSRRSGSSTPKCSTTGVAPAAFASSQPFSSDSDAENGEQFFVPSRPRSSSSNAYDGEPEQSDTDHGN